MAKVLYADQTGCAIYTPAPSGDPDDPFVNPLDHLDLVDFHSEFDYYSIIGQAQTVINHAAVAGVTGNSGNGTVPGSVTIRLDGQVVETDHLLYTHSLGYVPKFFVSINGKMWPHGAPVQRLDASRVRFVCAYATATEIRLKVTSYSSTAALTAVSVTYDILVFKDHGVSPDSRELNLQAGDVVFGKGKFQSGEPHLRLAGVGDTTFAIATTRTVDMTNGGMRIYASDSTAINYGSYDGTMAAPTLINVGVPT